MKPSKEKIAHALAIIGPILGALVIIAVLLCLTGCGHNAVQYSDGIGLEIGFVPEQYQVAVNFRYGKILSAVVKEKAEVTLESTGDFSAAENPASASTNATTKLTLKTGDQITGYVVDLAEVEAKK